jgi:hypothetical protein
MSAPARAVVDSSQLAASVQLAQPSMVINDCIQLTGPDHQTQSHLGIPAAHQPHSARAPSAPRISPSAAAARSRLLLQQHAASHHHAAQVASKLKVVNSNSFFYHNCQASNLMSASVVIHSRPCSAEAQLQPTYSSNQDMAWQLACTRTGCMSYSL